MPSFDVESLGELLASAFGDRMSARPEIRDRGWVALEALDDANELPLLIALAASPDPVVRAAVASRLPLADDEAAADSPIVNALIALLEDSDRRVRDWAAFSMDDVKSADSPRSRAALHGLLLEEDTVDSYPAASAALVLAKWGDTSAVPVIREHLTPICGKLWLDAASFSRDASLLPPLKALRADGMDTDDPWVQSLDNAIASCSP